MAGSSDDGRKRSFQEFRETESLSEALAVWETLRDRDGRGLRDLGEVWQAGATVSGFLAGLAGVQEDLRGGCAGLAGRKAVVVGAGPVGLVQATMLALMGAKVQLVEARKEFSRNNVVHLWPSTLEELKALGIKLFLPKLGAGGLHHVAIKALQLALLKLALVSGCQVFSGLSVTDCQYRHADGGHWIVTAAITSKPTPIPTSSSPTTTSTSPSSFSSSSSSSSASSFSSTLSMIADETIDLELPVDILVAADGEHSSVARMFDFPFGMFQAGPAIGVTANFVHDASNAAERKAQETNVSSHFARESFARLTAASGLVLENLVYFRDDTHYLVFSPKKACLLRLGVLKSDRATVEELLKRDNVDSERLLDAARSIARHVGLPEGLQFAKRGPAPDVAIFDFTRKQYALRSHRVIANPQRQLLVSSTSATPLPLSFRSNRDLMVLAVGDALVAPFWPQGTGIARGVCGVFDHCFFLRELHGPACEIRSDDRAATLAARVLQSKVFLKSGSLLTELRRLTPEEAILKPSSMPFSRYLKPSSRYKAMKGVNENLGLLLLPSPQRRQFEDELGRCLSKKLPLLQQQ